MSVYRTIGPLVILYNTQFAVIPLLKIAERTLPKKYTRTGLEFNPLAIEWKVLTLYHFRAELNLQDGKKSQTGYRLVSSGSYIPVGSID